jgi:hypothetical protein
MTENGKMERKKMPINVIRKKMKLNIPKKRNK